MKALSIIQVTLISLLLLSGCEYIYPHANSPAIANRVVCFGSGDGHLYAVDVTTGQPRWRFKTEDRLLSSPLVVNGIVYFGNYEGALMHMGVHVIGYTEISNGRLYAVNINTGQEQWRFETNGQVSSSPAIANGVVYFGSWDSHLYAVDANTGQERWRFKTEDRLLSSPLVVNGIVYFGSWDSHLYAVDANTGQERWRFKTEGRVNCKPTIASGMVYFGSEGGHFYAVNATTGQEKWKLETAEDISYYFPAIEQGVVYCLGREGWREYLDAVEIETGQRKWEFTSGIYLISYPAVIDDSVYVVCNYQDATAEEFYGQLYALDAATGVRKWAFVVAAIKDKQQEDRDFFFCPAVASGIVYVGSFHGNLYALDTQTGQLKWQFKP